MAKPEGWRRPPSGGAASEGATQADALQGILEDVAAGRLGAAEALSRLTSDFPIADLGFARLDTLREARTGVPEAVFGQGKLPQEILAIAQRLHAVHGRVLVTRVDPAGAAALLEWRPDARWNRRGRTVVLNDRGAAVDGGHVLIVAAGTTDLPVAEEAAETAAFCGDAVRRLNDVGVAGLHRLLAAVPQLRAADVIIAVAGMEGALPGVAAGLTDRPVIGVPTAVGYGVAEGGHAALRTMLASCSPGLAVVNIDNGFGAAVLAHRIRALVARRSDGAGV